MSDDFGTVSVKRGDRAREIEVLRQQYRTHRESLGRLAADAPTEALAAEYQRLIASIDASMRKLDELEGRPASGDLGDTQKMSTSPGMRPLAGTPTTPPLSSPLSGGRYEPAVNETASSTPRMLLIVIGGLIVLGIIGWLIFRASSDRHPKTGPITETTATTITNATGTESPITPAPVTTAEASAGVLKIAPAVNDYGVIRKGTRVVRQFALTNSGTTPLDIQIARSNCRCLFYEYNAKVAPGKKETITVAVDGARAKPGAIDEHIAVTAKSDPSISATLEVRGTVK